MSAFETLAALLTLTAVFAYVNHRWLGQPPSIALMAMTLGLSLLVLGAARAGWVRVEPLLVVIDRIHFDDTLLHGMLGTLLFAGALHVRLDDLREERLTVSTLALAGTLLSTFAVAALAYLTLRPLGFALSFGYCLLFGAVISPTDPIAVLGILKQARVPRRMEIQISGESLFNDGVAVVVFTTVLEVVTQGRATVGATVLLFLREALGGVCFGLVTGYATFRLLRSIDHYQTELLLTIALVLGGYATAERLHVSAPISAVVAGLLIGNQGRARGMSDVTRDHLDKFWALIDEILNAVLFVLVGFEVIRLRLTPATVLAGAIAVPSVLAARFLSVALPVTLMARRAAFSPGTIRVLTWGGLRGGISVALALSTPAGPERGLIVTMTYLVVTFSILVQGLTLGRVARRFGA
ncbi:MAG TPA: sodium:proton antiporter [Polyangiaceae bacterium]|nr:sodium:proton antiporter [Polyangiaceae bacterium]